MGLALALGACRAPRFKKLSGGLSHTVLFWFRKDAPRTKIDELERLYREEVPGQRGVALVLVGRARASDRKVVDSSYDLFTTIVFLDEAAERRWQSSPLHVGLRKRFSPFFDHIVVYDAR